MHDAGSAVVVECHVAQVRDLAPVPLRRAADWMPPIWWDRPVDRVLVVSGWLDVWCVGQAGHYVRLTWDGEVLCSRLGRVRVGDVGEAAREILRRIPRVEEFWFFLLPPPGAVGEWPGAHPLPPHTPCWEPRVGGRTLYLAATGRLIGWPTAPRFVPSLMLSVPVRRCAHDEYGSPGLPFSVFALFCT